MVHHLNTNKQFMIANGILAFAIIVVVVAFVYLSMQLQSRRKSVQEEYTETYSITLAKGFAGDSISLLLNDSILLDRRIDREPVTIDFTRFAKYNTLLVVDMVTEDLSLFELSNKGGNYRIEREGGEMKLLTQE